VIVGGVWIGNRIYRTLAKLVTTSNYCRFLNSHTSQFTTALEKSYESPVGVTTQRLSTMGTPLPAALPPGRQSLRQSQIRTDLSACTLRVKIKVTLRLAVYLEEHVCQSPMPQSLRERISQVTAKVDESQLLCIWEGFDYRVDIYKETNRAHIGYIEINFMKFLAVLKLIYFCICNHFKNTLMSCHPNHL
jgi:hypothetical protein